jgi:hypothetical protein
MNTYILLPKVYQDIEVDEAEAEADAGSWYFQGHRPKGDGGFYTQYYVKNTDQAQRERILQVATRRGWVVDDKEGNPVE